MRCSYTMDDLVDAVRKQTGESNRAFRNSARDYSYGADGGHPGFTYYSDTVKFYDENEDMLWALMAEMADEFGHKNVLEFVGSWNCASGIVGSDTFKNAVAWWALESAARHARPDL